VVFRDSFSEASILGLLLFVLAVAHAKRRPLYWLQRAGTLALTVGPDSHVAHVGGPRRWSRRIDNAKPALVAQLRPFQLARHPRMTMPAPMGTKDEHEPAPRIMRLTFVSDRILVPCSTKPIGDT
jgi:hypothetical protein